jgi:phosphoglycolate phosphatase
MTLPRFEAQALLFDLDGTLLDTLTDLWAACSAMLEDLGRQARTREEIHSFVGKGFRHLIWRCLGEEQAPDSPFILQAEALFKQHYERVNGAHTTLYPGVVSTLKQAQDQGLVMACVTNKAHAFTRPLLDKMGLSPFFRCVVAGDTLPTRKPEPEMLLHACAQLGVRPAHALMVGDSQNDALAAQRAGIPVVLVRYGYAEGLPIDAIACDARLSTMPELMDCLRPKNTVRGVHVGQSRP